VIDEQHRWGGPAAALRPRAKPEFAGHDRHADPRSLALTVFGDLDLSLIEQMPPNASRCRPVMRPVGTTPVHPLPAEHGRQAFIIYPLVEIRKWKPRRRWANSSACSRVFPNFRLGLLHRRLKPDERNVMAIRAGEYDVLVSTSVVEARRAQCDGHPDRRRQPFRAVATTPVPGRVQR
jgi:ATP-dependent DNA helicase RecG